jgi:flagellar biosynthetic protein FliR
VNPALNPFEPGPAAGLALFATRMGGLMLVAPVYSAKTVPGAVRTAVVVILTIALAPALLARGGPPPVVGAVTLVSELLIGVALGIGVAVFIGAAEVAGDVISLQTGLSGAGSLDPLTQLQSQTLSDFLKMLVTTLWLAVGGHLIVLEVLADSATMLPPGEPIAARNGLFALIQLGTLLFAMGLQIAAPVVAAVFAGNVAMGVLARTAPQLQVFMLAYPLQIAIGVTVLALSLPFLGVTVGGWPEQYRSVVANLFDAMAR